MVHESNQDARQGTGESDDHDGLNYKLDFFSFYDSKHLHFTCLKNNGRFLRKSPSFQPSPTLPLRSSNSRADLNNAKYNERCFQHGPASSCRREATAAKHRWFFSSRQTFGHGCFSPTSSWRPSAFAGCTSSDCEGEEWEFADLLKTEFQPQQSFPSLLRSFESGVSHEAQSMFTDMETQGHSVDYEFPKQQLCACSCISTPSLKIKKKKIHARGGEWRVCTTKATRFLCWKEETKILV